MPHHDSCGHEAHDHDHDYAEDGPRDDLLSRIDMQNVVALNCDIPSHIKAENVGRQILKPWVDRMDEHGVSVAQSFSLVRFILMFFGASTSSQMRMTNCKSLPAFSIMKNKSL